jgi:hypothetical protein
MFARFAVNRRRYPILTETPSSSTPRANAALGRKPLLGLEGKRAGLAAARFHLTVVAPLINTATRPSHCINGHSIFQFGQC